jgi:hypothetical protein
MCGPTAPTALRRRSIRSSDRGRDFVFGSSLGRPGEHDDCLALSRRSSLLEMPEPRAAKGPPPGGASGSPAARVLRDAGDGFDAACSLLGGQRAREWRAGGHTSGCERLRRAVSPHVRGQPRKDGGKELEPPAAALRSRRWVAHESLRRCVAITSATAHLRVSDRRGGPPLGADPLASPSWPVGDAAEAALLRERCRSHSDRARSFLREQPDAGRMEPDRAETPCLPPTFGSGDAEAVRAARRNVQRELGGARAWQRRKRVDPKPKGASSGRATATSHERNGLLGGRKP